MFAASTYDEIEAIAQKIKNMQIVVFLFVKPCNQDAMDIIKEFEYIHYNSEKYCSVFAIGYSDDFCKATDKDYQKIDAVLNGDWYFSTKAFVDFKNKLEKQIKWRYSGETEILILQNSPGAMHPLNFKNYVAIDVNKGIREGYIDSFQRFMESLVRSSKSQVTAKEVIQDVRNHQISIKSIITDAIDECKKIPSPVKRIVKDRLFYRCANSRCFSSIPCEQHTVL